LYFQPWPQQPKPAATSATKDDLLKPDFDDHAQHCVIGAREDDQAEKTQELMAAVGRLMRRG